MIHSIPNETTRAVAISWSVSTTKHTDCLQILRSVTLNVCSYLSQRPSVDVVQTLLRLLANRISSHIISPLFSVYNPRRISSLRIQNASHPTVQNPWISYGMSLSITKSRIGCLQCMHLLVSGHSSCGLLSSIPIILNSKTAVQVTSN